MTRERFKIPTHTLLILGASVFLLSIPASSFALTYWQMGGLSYNSASATGVRSAGETVGKVPAGLAIFATTGFTDTPNGLWHAMAIYTGGGGTSDTITAEYTTTPGGAITPIVLCSGLAGSTYYTNTIQYIPSANSWHYYSSGSGCTLYIFTETSSSVNSGGSFNIMESTDQNANDFANSKAEVLFEPTLQYYASGSWQNTVTGYTLVSSNGGGYAVPPSNMGLSMTCSSIPGYVSSTVVSNSNAPPPANNIVWAPC